MDVWELLVLPIALGLLGFVEPCSIGASLLFVRYLEGEGPAAKVRETLVFAATRALLIGGLGASAGLMGALFLELQRGFWILLGGLYVALGLAYLTGRQGRLEVVLGPSLARAQERRGAAALGLLFGLNIPACAAPLVAAVMGVSLGAASVVRGFVVMSLFGLALSLPLIAAVLSGRARAWLDRLARLSRHAGFWTGAVLVVLGVWSITWGVRG